MNKTNNAEKENAKIGAGRDRRDEEKNEKRRKFVKMTTNKQ